MNRWSCCFLGYQSSPSLTSTLLMSITVSERMSPTEISSSVSLNIPESVLQRNPTLLNISLSGMTFNLGHPHRVRPPSKNLMLNNGNWVPILKKKSKGLDRPP